MTIDHIVSQLREMVRTGASRADITIEVTRKMIEIRVGASTAHNRHEDRNLMTEEEAMDSRADPIDGRSLQLIANVRAAVEAEPTKGKGKK